MIGVLPYAMDLLQSQCLNVCQLVACLRKLVVHGCKFRRLLSVGVSQVLSLS